MSDTTIEQQHARLTILRILAEGRNYTSNVSMISEILVRYGLAFGRDRILTELAWLEEQGLITTETLPNDFVVATAKSRGCDVAAGVVVVPGIQRPRPRA